MNFIIKFFRDVLDGPLYIVVSIISGILICSCIGYLAEVSINKKKAKQQYDASHTTISNTQTSNNSVMLQPSENDLDQIKPTQVSNQVNTSTMNTQQMPQQNISNSIATPQYSQSPIINQQPTSIPNTAGTDIVPPTVANTNQNINYQ